MRINILSCLVFGTVLAACNTVPKETRIISSTTHSKELLQKNGSTMAGLVGFGDDLAGNESAGGDFEETGMQVWVDGPEIEGLRLTATGDAFATGLLGPPKYCRAEVQKDNGDPVDIARTASFTTSGKNTYTADFPDLPVRNLISFKLTIPALRHGSGSYAFTIAPLEKTSKLAPYTYRHSINVQLQHQPPL